MHACSEDKTCLAQMYLTLPLPVSKTVSVNVVLVQADGSAAPQQCAVDVPKTGTFKHLYQAVAKVLPHRAFLSPALYLDRLRSFDAWHSCTSDQLQLIVISRHGAVDW